MKIALIGYGKMGHMIEEIALSRGHEIVSIIDADNREDFDSEAFRSADVAIEFTAPSAAYDNCLRAFAAGVKVVSGSTGWFAEHEAEMRHLCAEEGRTLFWASNFSLGVAVFGAVNKFLARIMNSYPQYEVQEVEAHHIHKLDHPSGTGITLAEQIVEQLDRKTGWQMGNLTQPDGTIVPAAQCDPAKLTIHSVREGEEPGLHSIQWSSEADQITITHKAFSRRGFALGAVMAAEFTATHSGFLSTDDLFNF